MINTDNNINRFDRLWERQDGDLNLYYLEEFILKGEDKRSIPSTISVTLNDPRVFGDAAMALLSVDKRIFDITGVDPTIQNKLEKEFTNWLYLNDENLATELIEPLDTCFNFFGCFRGWAGALPLMYQDGDKYLPVIRPLDPRWMMWELGSKGMKWASYRIRMDKAQAEELYGKKFDTSAKDIELSCVWDDANYYIFSSDKAKLGGKEALKTIPHNLGFCPIVITPVPTQPLLISSGDDAAIALSRQGEGIYAPVRALIPLLNEVASVWATINRQQFMTPLAYTGTRDLKGQSIFGFGIIVQLNQNEKLEPIQLRDMSPSAQALFGQIFARWERATMSTINTGQLSFELSALAIADLKSDRDKVLIPRRKFKTTMHRKIFEVFRKQINHNCYKTDIDKDQDTIEIDKTLFEKKFVINIGFDSISPQENIANAQLSQQWKGLGMPMEWILRNVAKVDDPMGVLRQAKLERLYSMLPLLELADSAIALGSGDVTEEEINQIKAKLIKKTLMEQLSQMTALEKPPNIASQPTPDLGLGRASSEKLAAAQSERTGQQKMTTALRAKTLGGGE